MMSRRSRRRKSQGFTRRTRPGAAPGTLVHDPLAPRPAIHVIAYGTDQAVERNIEDVDAIRPLLERWPVTWINIDGLGDAAVIRRLGRLFQLHKLALEDVINVHQRAKVEQYENCTFIVARAAYEKSRLETEQVSLFLGANFVLTFQERAGDSFDAVRERIRKAGGRIRSAGPDYLAYALLDAIIDGYYPVLEAYGEKLEDLEDEVLLHPAEELIHRIHQARRDLLWLRRAAWPLREAVNSLHRDPSPLVADETRVYLRDCYDHTIQIIDLLENYRELAAGLLEVYLSSMSNRLNEIMKVLTIFAAIFIPLGFIAALYGMNFDPGVSPWNMPELRWAWGYPFALGLMAAVAGGMLMFFAKKGWLPGRARSRARRRQPTEKTAVD